jgi:hypothetical protein
VFQALQAVGVSPARNSMQPRGLMLYEQQTPRPKLLKPSGMDQI